METSNVVGIDLAYTIHGSGEDPVILIAGLSGRGSGWGEQASRFAEDFTTIIPDHPGTGASGMPTEFTLDHHAQAMAELIRSLGCGPAHIVGSSTGGAIALLMALDHPDVVRTIVPVSSWARADDFFRHQFAVRKAVLRRSGTEAYAEATALFLFSAVYFRDHYDRVRIWCDAASGGSPDVMARRIDMILAHDVLDRLGDITAPTAVVVGAQDGCTPPHLSQQLAESIGGAEFHLLEGGHLIYKESPSVFHRTVRDFIIER